MKTLININNLNELESFAEILAKLLQKSDYILFHGEIGAGKTTLIKLIAKTLGIDERNVSSPSFVIINEYIKDKIKIFHIDIYKLGDETSISDIGLDDYYLEDGIILIEWAEYLKDLNINKGLHIKINILENETRNLEIYSNDMNWQERFNKLVRTFNAKAPASSAQHHKKD
jgi:tRNA threonylcarbamoyladenosine biosynthesis protein TsaE